ncbi:Hypothetical predicted protein [Podarcis lilfordi]|uniref:Uncharacterized protein n=1 Tax=Podarcis lilfordi TaxID=74358 RepID=A0AA35LGA4_9SAUR|nr:Hypothetical predicted protein [Podarcis lilfordi]
MSAFQSRRSFPPGHSRVHTAESFVSPAPEENPSATEQKESQARTAGSQSRAERREAGWCQLGFHVCLPTDAKPAAAALKEAD